MIFNYLTTNKINRKRYVGAHDGSFSDGYLGSGNFIKAAIKKYGRENFQRDILNVVTTRKEAFHNEKFLIEMYKTLTPKGYNISLTGGTSFEEGRVSWNKGLTNETDERVKRGSEKKKGKPSWISGKHHTEETKAKMRETRMGENNSMYGRSAYDIWLIKYGKREADERKQNAADRLKENRVDNSGEKNPMYGRTGEAHPMYGKHPSNETRQKISEAAKKRTGEKSGMYGKHHSNETKQKLSDAKKGEKSPYYGKNGKDHPMSKPILQYTLKGVFLKEWESATQVKKVLGFCNTSIGKCAQEKISTSYGYIWKFKETESKKAK